MSRRAFVVLVAALAACGRGEAPPAPPSASELGAELATFRQILVPLSPATAENAKLDPENFKEVYELGTTTSEGASIGVLVAYSDPWLLPASAIGRPMSVLQFLRAFGQEERAQAAALVAPKGQLYFTRAQLPGVLAGARTAGASDADLPFSAVKGSAR